LGLRRAADDVLASASVSFGRWRDAQSLKDSPQVTVEWNAQMTLIGGRERETRQFSGNQAVLMSFTSQPGARALDFRTP
jgi:hypothetical protein